eukprot:SAG25_NODE_13109_length_271_cov_0.604651_1_plen_36_part_10
MIIMSACQHVIMVLRRGGGDDTAGAATPTHNLNHLH